VSSPPTGLQREVAIIDSVFNNIEQLTALSTQVRELLVTFEDYSDAERALMARFLVETDGDVDRSAKMIMLSLNRLKRMQELRLKNTRDAQVVSSNATMRSYKFLIYLLIFAGVGLVVGSILIATFTSRSIVRPVARLRNSLQMLGKGIIPSEELSPRDDEIGEMTVAMNNLIDGFRRTTDFSRQVGIGNFNYQYRPLSDDDVLGHALLKMRDDLAENERILEQKVIERTEEVVRQKEEIEKQRQKLEELYKDVTDSIRYAKRLQDSILPPDPFVRQLLPESFVLFKPKDIVSGDFYWFYKKQEKVLFAAVDCTGHGVPGAFMSLVGANALNQAVKEHGHTEPARILDDLNKLSSEALNQNKENSLVRDGMDLAFCTLDTKTLELEYAGANNPLYLIRNGELKQIKADKVAIGAFEPGARPYTNHKLQLEKGDSLYVFSDGYADQFGGLQGKKFMYRQFRDMLLSMRGKSMDQQRILLNDTIEKWRGNYEQVDDILIIGVRV
jgi:serine phosphatase RsbU (regulator of sigma subunit)